MQVPELQRHYSEWEITGAPEIRHVIETSAQPFNPFEPPAQAQAIDLGATVGTVRRSAGLRGAPSTPLLTSADQRATSQSGGARWPCTCSGEPTRATITG